MQAVDAVNTLGCGLDYRPSGGAPSEAMAAAQAVVQEAVEQFPRPRDDVKPDEALRLLLQSGGKYDAVTAAGALTPFGSGELSLYVTLASVRSS